MNKTLLTIFRTATSATLIVGSVFVQHVAREQQPQHRHAGLQLQRQHRRRTCGLHHRKRQGVLHVD